jgi:hypothetical protein
MPVLALLLGATTAKAAESDPMVVFLDHAELLRLTVAATRVIIGNPALAEVTVESPRLVSIFGKSAGETNLIILDGQDHALVARPLRITQGSNGAVAVHVPGRDGPAERLYSCVDGRCLRVRSGDDNGKSPTAAPPPPPPPEPAAAR